MPWRGVLMVLQQCSPFPQFGANRGIAYHGDLPYSKLSANYGNTSHRRLIILVEKVESLPFAQSFLEQSFHHSSYRKEACFAI